MSFTNNMYFPIMSLQGLIFVNKKLESLCLKIMPIAYLRSFRPVAVQIKTIPGPLVKVGLDKQKNILIPA